MEVRETVELIKKIIETEKCIVLYNNDKILYQDFVRGMFPSFAKEYPILFKKVIFKEDLSNLEMMLRAIEKIQSGQDHKEITNKIGEKLAEDYLYPVLGKPPPKDENDNEEKKMPEIKIIDGNK